VFFFTLFFVWLSQSCAHDRKVRGFIKFGFIMSDYYYSFKIYLKSRPEIRPRSRVRRVKLGWPKSTLNKSGYYHSFKSWLGCQLGQGPGHELGGSHGLTRVDVWIKMVIIIVLKSDLGVDLRQGSNHWLGGLTRITQFFF
jgi:hypothetical protein